MALPDFKDLRRRFPIEEIVSERIRLQRQGRALVGRCPFHQDKGRPNLTVYPETQTYYCFVCQARGDVVDFVARLEGLTQGEAAKRLGDRAPESQHRVTFTKPGREIDLPRRAPEHLDMVYRVFLGTLELGEAHRRDLVRRGLTPEAIHERAYRTLPDRVARDAATSRLVRQLGADALRSVPGFGIEHGRWTTANVEGLLIPVLDVSGRIVGMQVRTAYQRGKYRWLSTPSLEGGASSGGPAHVRLPERGRGRIVWLTEGPLKADVVAVKLRQCVVAVPGVGAWGRALEVIDKLRPRTVIVAFDQDTEVGTAFVVGKHTRDLARVLRRKYGVRVCVASWTSGKGIDDALVLGEKPTVEVLV